MKTSQPRFVSQRRQGAPLNSLSFQVSLPTKKAETGARSSPRGREGGDATSAFCASGVDRCPRGRGGSAGEPGLCGHSAAVPGPLSLCPALVKVFCYFCSSPSPIPASFAPVRHWCRRCCPQENKIIDEHKRGEKARPAARLGTRPSLSSKSGAVAPPHQGEASEDTEMGRAAPAG